MSHKSFYNKLKESDENQYSYYCVIQKPGCMHRHGPPLTNSNCLEALPCPNCMEKLRSIVGLSLKEIPRFSRRGRPLKAERLV